MRDSGLDRPFNQLQVLTWALLPFLVITFYVFVIPVLPTALLYAASIKYAVFAIASAVFGFLTTATNPIDPKLSEQLIKNPKPQLKDVHQHDDDEKFCVICVANTSTTSQHCRYCEKCVEGFDHHCKWLNNCVGKANYKYFFMTVTSVLLFLIIHIAYTVYIIAYAGVDHSGFREDLEDAYGADFHSAAYLAIVSVLGVVLLILATLVAQLFFFHIYLMRKGITTYDYVINS
mmetsp:Transcript_9606/g.28206  ORF Transcript_9606/g.28206 Transcript_9606/m.28206 type:complete len:232 (-) Transcript_9606:65-760(-)